MNECPRCLLTDNIAGVIIGEKQCNYCNLHDTLKEQYPVDSEAFDRDCKHIKEIGTGRQYDCLLGISGGFDSSYLAYKLHARGIRVLLLHYNNGFDTEEARLNMTAIVKKTGYDFIDYTIGQKEFIKVSKAFLEAGVSDADIPNDMAMGKLMMDTAIKYGVKVIINGHNFRTEGSCPIGWTYMDGKYIESVYGKKPERLPVLGAFDQVKLAWHGIKTYRLLYHCCVDKNWEKHQLEKWCGWKDYGGHHCENIYTEFVGWYIWKAFGIDKRTVELSAFIRSGITTKEKAKEELKRVPGINIIKLDIVLDALGMDRVDLEPFLNQYRRTFSEYKTYHKLFRRIKPLIWLAVKANILPRTFYEKYTKEVVWPKS